MKKLLIATSALMLLTACGSKTGTGASGDTGAAPIAAPAGTKWSETTSVTPDGGMLMGNPNAPVKLIEYGALTCSHCAEFSEKSKVELKALVDKGTVSYEFRTFVLNQLDIPASLLAKCNGPASFFPLAEQLFASQRDWLGKTQDLTEADQQALQGMNPVQLTQALATKLGLVDFVQQRGVPAAKAQACIADAKAIDALAALTEKGMREFKVQGTPTFIINGVTQENTSAWDVLKPKLMDAGA
ncbi:MAG: DsbA family protein [Sphingomonadaceae bacterium]|jgi:protein-disulfide isomerase|nr:DsbA family protein [Sphingomonadaceae bacterium]NBU77662.1 DsbA family protein [Sphingomonadaceae bacterium]NCA01971.1 DsbA family protein [Sphingomonadaceae bacterium]